MTKINADKIVVVTGGAGYIGSHTVVALSKAGYTPVILDDFRNAKPWIIDRLEQLLGKRPQSFPIDCNNEEEVDSVFSTLGKIHGIIHFAAYKAVGESVKEPVKYYQNNVGSLCTMLDQVKKHQIPNFVFSSSCTVYGEADDPVVTEETPIQKATSPYGDTKITCEKIIRFFCDTGDKSKAILLRYFNPIGAHESGLIGELPQGVPNNLVPYVTQTAKGIREKLVVFGDDYDTVDGTNVRDYIHVTDLAEAHVAALNYLEQENAEKCEEVNLGTGKGTSVLQLIQAFEEVNHLTLNYEIGARRDGDVSQIYANTDKAKELLKWSYRYSLKEALKHSWEWEQKIDENEE